MVYFIEKDWSYTFNNHAGLKYLYNAIESKYPIQYKSIDIPENT